MQIEEMEKEGRQDPAMTQSCHLPSFPVMLGPRDLQLQGHFMVYESCLLGGP